MPRPGTGIGHCRRGGFTLLELTIVVLLVGILAAAAAPRIGEAVTRQQADAAARRIKADLEWARRSARLAGLSRTVAVNVTTNRYDMAGIADPNHPGQTYGVDLGQTGYAVTLASVTPPPAQGSSTTNITFDMYGRPAKDATVVIQQGSEQRTVRVDGVTGQVSITNP